MASSVHWYGHVLRREDACVLSSSLKFEVEGQRENRRLIMTRMKHVDEESNKVGLSWEDVLCRSMFTGEC